MSNVVVMGAGLAGLAAARWLMAHGHEVTVVVEAGERAGGRTDGPVLDDGTPSSPEPGIRYRGTQWPAII